MTDKPNQEDFIQEGLSEEEIGLMNDEGADPVESMDDADTDTNEDDDQAPGNEPGQVEGQSTQSKTVPLEALQEARAESREMRERYARLEERTNMMLQQMQSGGKKDEPEAPEEPDWDTDPIARAQLIEKKLQDFEQQTQQRTQQEQQDQQWNQAVQYLDQQFNQEAQTDPSVNEAFDFARQSVEKELHVYGYQGQHLENQMNTMMRQMTANAYQMAQRGMSVGDFVKQYATTRGWTPQQTAQAAQQKPDIPAMASRQDRHRSLSDASGGEAPQKLDAKTLASMSDSEYKKLLSTKDGAAEVDRIMAGG